jgi:putative methyltransferase (TIGR04325 family)
MHRTQPYDYPVLFWLTPILLENTHVLDVGGNVGVHYYVYQKHVPYPTGLRWTVCELLNLIAKGVRLLLASTPPRFCNSPATCRPHGASTFCRRLAPFSTWSRRRMRRSSLHGENNRGTYF